MSGSNAERGGTLITAAGTVGGAVAIMEFTVAGEVRSNSSDWDHAHDEAVRARNTLQDAATVSRNSATQQELVAEVAVRDQKIHQLQATKPEFTGIGAEYGAVLVAGAISYTASRLVLGIGKRIQAHRSK